MIDEKDDKRIAAHIRAASAKAASFMPPYNKKAVDTVMETARKAAADDKSESAQAYCMSLCIAHSAKIADLEDEFNIRDLMEHVIYIHLWYDAAERLTLQDKGSPHGDDNEDDIPTNDKMAIQ